jgi:hypothetical protein
MASASTETLFFAGRCRALPFKRVAPASPPTTTTTTFQQRGRSVVPHSRSSFASLNDKHVSSSNIQPTAYIAGVPNDLWISCFSLGSAMVRSHFDRRRRRDDRPRVTAAGRSMYTPVYRSLAPSTLTLSHVLSCLRQHNAAVRQRPTAAITLSPTHTNRAPRTTSKTLSHSRAQTKHLTDGRRRHSLDVLGERAAQSHHLVTNALTLHRQRL